MNILLTSVGRRTYLVRYFQNALSPDGKVFASNSEMTYAMLQADDYVITPPIYHKEYISFLIDYCKSNNISAILSCFDIDIPVLASHKKVFQEEGIQLVVSDYKTAEICNDKWLTYNKLKEIGIRTPETFVDIDSVKQRLKDNKLLFPLIMKPRWGMGSIGIMIVENMDELDVFYAKLQRIIFNTYLKYESQIDAEKCIVVQEMIKGQEYGLDILNDLNGEFVTIIAKKKIALRAGETDIAEIVDNKTFLEVGKKLSASLRHIGNLDVDCFINQNDEISILELNCRFGGQYPFSHLSGVDFPKQIIEWLKGHPTCNKFLTPHIGTRCCKDLTPVILLNH